MAREPLSRGDLLVLAAILAVAGTVVAAYLTYEHFVSYASSVCDINDFWSCSAVGNSPYGALAGIPTSSIGLAGFLVLFGLTVAAFRGTTRIGPWSVDRWLLVFAIVGALIGFGLTLIEIFLIHAICILCATGFGLDLGILGVALVLRRTE